jgi:D-aminopeptidase
MSERKRLRDLGIKIGNYPPGPYNAITDVANVKVGHITLNQTKTNGAAVRTGVTAILPHDGNLFHEKVAASSYVINGFGKTTGLIQVEELGTIESPILLTNTFGVPAATEGALQYLFEQNPEIGDTTGTVNVVVGECNDGYLNDIRGLHVRPEHVMEAIRSAKSGPVEEGAVGAGTGMMCFQYKGGIGTSSRQVDIDQTTYTIGCLVLTNFGKRADLRLPVGSLNGTETIKPLDSAYPEPADLSSNPPDGSIMMILATDAPLSDRQLKRLAKRASFGLSRTGSHASHGSGDIAIAFSTAHRIDHHPKDHELDYTIISEEGSILSSLFQMTVESVEEAIWNSLCKAETTTGRQERVVAALPYSLFNKYHN